MRTDREIGENFLLAKISAYTIHPKCYTYYETEQATL